MVYLIYLISVAVVIGYFTLFTRNEKLNKFKFYDKLIAIFLMCVFVVKYFSIDKRHVLGQTFVGLDSFSALGLSKAQVLFSLITDWLSIAIFVLCAMKFFFKPIKTVDRIIKYVAPISSILNIVFAFSIQSIMLGERNDSITLFIVLFAIESGITIAMSAHLILSDIFNGYYKENKFSIIAVVKTIGILLLMLVAALPVYFLQFTVGFYKGYAYAYDISPTHRIYIYLMFIIPMLLYFALRNKDENVIRFSLIYISVAMMVTYSVGYSYATMLDLSAWPFHLCNTAMYVIPITLIFKWKKLFYFTYFINVLGAFFAMVMPNYDEQLNILSSEMFYFWYNHWAAFFFPLLCVALKQFERPNIKRFGYSMAWFLLYFVLVLFLNVYFSARGKVVDYFFINSDFIAEKLGKWAEDFFKNSAVSFTIGEYTYTFHLLYQVIFYLVYVALGFGMWFIYELFFNIAEEHISLNNRLKKIKLDKYALLTMLDGRSEGEPMDPNAGIKLELKSFSKKYGANKYYSVENASLTVYGGEIFGFLGPNGAGKSTIIKSIVGIQPITEGSIEVCGYDCAKQPVMSKKQIGYVPDHYALYEKLTGREYVNYIADIFEVSQEDRDARIAEYVKIFELEHSFDNQIKTYSHGMKQKITIISALVHNPKLWILDEPLTGLDPNSIFQVKECMRSHAAAGNIVFFSSHLIDVVEKLCDRIAIIKKGHVQCIKTIEEIEAECPLEEFYLKTIGEEEMIAKIKSEGEKATN